jgi:hypothetical protein
MNVGHDCLVVLHCFDSITVYSTNCVSCSLVNILVVKARVHTAESSNLYMCTRFPTTAVL